MNRLQEEMRAATLRQDNRLTVADHASFAMGFLIFYFKLKQCLTLINCDLGL